MNLNIFPSFICKRCKHFFGTLHKNNASLIKKYLGQNVNHYATDNKSRQSRNFNAILATKSVNESILILRNTNEKLETSEIAASCEKLSEHFFKTLKLQPWAVHDDETSLWIQGNINFEAEELILPILKSSEFSTIIEEVVNNTQMFTSPELLTVTKSLLHLHLPPENKVITTLICECIERIQTFSIAELATLSVICNRLNRTGVPILSQIISVFQEILSTDKTLCNELDDIEDFGVIMKNISYFLSETFLVSLLSKLNKLLENHTSRELVMHSQSILYCLEAASRFLSKPGEALVKNLSAFFLDNANSLSLWTLGRACIYLKHWNDFGPSESALLQKRATDFLHCNSASPTDIVSIITITSSYGVVENFTLFKKISFALENVLGSFDTLLLKSLEQSKFMSKCGNQNLTSRFNSCAERRLHDLIKSKSFLQRFLYMGRYSCVDPQNKMFHLHLCNLLMEQIEFGQMGLDPSLVCLIYEYFIFCTGMAPMPPTLNELLYRMLPQVEVLDIVCLLKQIKQQSSKLPNKAGNMNVLALKLKECIINRKNELRNLRSVNHTVEIVLQLSDLSQRKENVTQFSEVYEELSSTIDDFSLQQSLKTFQKCRLLVPQALQNFSEFVLPFKKCHLKSFALFLETCAILNFSPTNINKFQELASHIICNELENDRSLQSIQIVLPVAWSFAVMEMFPKDILNFIFSSEFMKTFDAACQSTFLENSKYGTMLLDLNRCVVLECLDLNIPWLHEFMGKNIPCGNVTTQFQLNVEQELEDLLGGPSYFKSNQLSPYFCHMDFECALTSDKLPIAIPHWKKHTGNTMQRVAILLLTAKDFCNVNSITGQQAMKRRHLEIMGYKVVQVPYYMNQNEFQRANNESLATFLKKNIFS